MEPRPEKECDGSRAPAPEIDPTPPPAVIEARRFALPPFFIAPPPTALYFRFLASFPPPSPPPTSSPLFFSFERETAGGGSVSPLESFLRFPPAAAPAVAPPPFPPASGGGTLPIFDPMPYEPEPLSRTLNFPRDAFDISTPTPAPAAPSRRRASSAAACSCSRRRRRRRRRLMEGENKNDIGDAAAPSAASSRSGTNKVFITCSPSLANKAPSVSAASRWTNSSKNSSPSILQRSLPPPPGRRSEDSVPREGGGGGGEGKGSKRDGVVPEGRNANVYDVVGEPQDEIPLLPLVVVVTPRGGTQEEVGPPRSVRLSITMPHSSFTELVGIRVDVPFPRVLLSVWKVHSIAIPLGEEDDGGGGGAPSFHSSRSDVLVVGTISSPPVVV